MTAFQTAGPDDIEVIQSLSHEIWNLHYPDVISREQIDYMLELMYSAEAIRTDMTEKHITYKIVLHDGRPAGYLAWGPEGKGVYKLHKCYLHPDVHGEGIGQEMLSHVREQLELKDAEVLLLAVNKQNAQGIRAYERFGFERCDSVVNDIGHGFVMDDYIMRYDLKKGSV